MSTTTHPASGMALPRWPHRTATLVISAIALAVAVLAVVLTQTVWASSGHSHSPAVVRIQHFGVASQNAPDECIYAARQLPRPC